VERVDDAQARCAPRRREPAEESPIASAKVRPSSTPPLDGRRRTVATLNVIMLKATPWSNAFTAHIAPTPRTTPPAKPAVASMSDSDRKDTRIASREKPSARSVPISAVRLATAAYMVLSAPNVAPVAMTTASTRTST
jgi:hypothetical protein